MLRRPVQSLVERKAELDDVLIQALQQISNVVIYVASRPEEFKAVRALAVHAMTHANAILEAFEASPPITAQQVLARHALEEFRRRSFDHDPLKETRVNDRVLLFTQDILEFLRVFHAVLFGPPPIRRKMVHLFCKRRPIPRMGDLSIEGG